MSTGLAMADYKLEEKCAFAAPNAASANGITNYWPPSVQKQGKKQNPENAALAAFLC